MAKDGYYMLITDNSTKFSVMHRSPFLRRVRENFYPIVIIDLYKVFSISKNDKYSLKFLIEKLKKEYNTSIWNVNIALQELDNFINRIDNESDKISKLKKLRDWHYAHKDKDKPSPLEIKAYYKEDIFVLIDLAKEIVDVLFEKVLKSPKEKFNYNGEEMNEFIDKYLEYIEKTGKYNLGLTNI